MGILALSLERFFVDFHHALGVNSEFSTAEIGLKTKKNTTKVDQGKSMGGKNGQKTKILESNFQLPVFLDVNTI